MRKTGRGRGRRDHTTASVRSEATVGEARLGARQNLRTIVEIAVVAILCSLVSAIAARSVLSDHGFTTTDLWYGISRTLLFFIGMTASWCALLVGGFLYGWRSQRHLRFTTVLIGWMIGAIVCSLIAPAVLSFLGFHALHHASTHHHHVPSWLRWPVSTVLFASLSVFPSLTAMWGQKRRGTKSESAIGMRPQPKK